MITENIIKTINIELRNLAIYSKELAQINSYDLDMICSKVVSNLHLLSGEMLITNHTLDEVNQILNIHCGSPFIYTINCAIDTDFCNKKMINALNHNQDEFTGLGTEMKNIDLIAIGIQHRELTNITVSDASILHDRLDALLHDIKSNQLVNSH